MAACQGEQSIPRESFKASTLLAVNPSHLSLLTVSGPRRVTYLAHKAAGLRTHYFGRLWRSVL